MSGFTMPHLQPTGTPLMPDRGAQGHLPNRGKARGPPSQSESDCGSSIDSQHSSMSSPTGTSPQTIQEEPPGNGPHAAAGTGLQLNLNLKPPSTPHFTTQGGNTPYSAMGGVSPMPGNSHPSYQNPHHRTDRAPRSNAQGPYMGANRNSKSSGLSGSSQVPPGYYNQRNPGPMARRYSDAITRRHVHSMSDPQLLMTATQRPRTSTSDSHSFSKQANHHHSMSVPNTAVLMSHGSPQMMVNRTSESSPSQAGFAAEFFQEQVAFQQPGLHGHVMHHPYPVYSSSSSSNVGLSFSPISQHSASFSNVENPAEYSTSAASASASYFSALSLQPTLPQDQHLFPSDSRVVATEAMADTWADMMPSMGVSTPLQELISGGGSSCRRLSSIQAKLANVLLSYRYSRKRRRIHTAGSRSTGSSSIASRLAVYTGTRCLRYERLGSRNGIQLFELSLETDVQPASRVRGAIA